MNYIFDHTRGVRKDNLCAQKANLIDLKSGIFGAGGTMIVRFKIKFNELFLLAPILTIAYTVAMLCVVICVGFTDAVYALLCVQALLTGVDTLLLMYVLNPFAALPTIISIVLVRFVTDSPDAIVRLVCLVCMDAVALITNVSFLLKLLNWHIAMDYEGFTYCDILHRKRYYKYNEVKKIEFFKFGYIVCVGNKRIKIYSHTRNSDALYEQLTSPNLATNKLKF